VGYRVGMMEKEILSYDELCRKVGTRIQKGMNYHLKDNLSVILMSVRPGARYADEIDPKRNLLFYEGHDVPKSRSIPDPKKVDQPLFNEYDALTENGQFVKAVERFKRGLSEAEEVLVFEKLQVGIWCEKGRFKLVDYEIRTSNGRKVFKFILEPILAQSNYSDTLEVKHNRIIPTSVKVQVWKRDKGRCVLCGSKENIHYDHDLPFSKGGSSITAKNIRILCAKCNLKKGAKIR